MAFDAGALVAKLKLDTKGFQAGVKQATGQTKGLEKQALSLSKVLGTTLAVGALGALALGFKKTVDAAGGFEKSMANVATLVDTAIIDINELSAAVLDMTTEVTKSADDLSAGLYQVFSAGVTDAAEAMDVLKVSAIAATAGLADTRSSVDAITTILNAYGLEATEATNISDLMFQTVKLGKTTFTELAGAIGTVIAPAASLGIKLEDLFSALATLTKGGFDTRTSTTALRATFLSILKPTDDAIKTAKELGLEWTASALKAKGLVKFLNELKAATGGNTETMAKLIPETRALNAVLALTGEQSGELNKILGEMEDSLGATREAFKKQEDTYEAQEKKLGLLVDRMQIKIGNIFLPTLTNMLKGVLGLFDAVGEEFEKLATGASKTKTEAEAAANKTQVVMKKIEDFLVGLGITTERELNKQIILWRKMGVEVPKLLSNYQKSIVMTALANIKLRKSFEEQAKTIAKAKDEANNLGKALEGAGNKGKKAAEKTAKSWAKIPDVVKEAFEKLGVLPKEQLAGQVQALSDAFETATGDMDVTQQDVIRLREGLFQKLKELSEAADSELIALGFDPDVLRETVNNLHEELLRGTSELIDTTTNEVLEGSKQIIETAKQQGDILSINIKSRTKDTVDLIQGTLDSLEGLITQVTNRQIGSFGSLVSEVDKYKDAYIAAEEAITEAVVINVDERLDILQRFVQTANGLSLQTVPTLPSVGNFPALSNESSTTNNINQSVTINNSGGNVEQGQNTIRAFDSLNASLAF